MLAALGVLKAYTCSSARKRAGGVLGQTPTAFRVQFFQQVALVLGTSDKHHESFVVCGIEKH